MIDQQALTTGTLVRHVCRSGEFTGQTSGLAQGFAQANLVVLPKELASDFLLFCQRNPKPCPLLAVTEPGNPILHSVTADGDVRTDLPRYRVWRQGRLVAEPTDILRFWRDDFVAFLIGCSFTFDAALLRAGVPVRHIELGCNVPMYRTNIACQSAGAFHGPLVVSMRPLTPINAIRAVRITSRYANVHGAPVHIALPEQIGISNLAQPDFGNAVPVDADELPVFWACGVTPQAAVVASCPPLMISHSPGCMFVTDLRDEEFAIE